METRRLLSHSGSVLILLTSSEVELMETLGTVDLGFQDSGSSDFLGS